MSELLVYERHPVNAALLGRVSRLKLKEVRSLVQLTQSLEQMEPSVLCLQVQIAELPAVASLVYRVKRDVNRPLAVIAMPEPSVRDHVLPLYEAGVDLVFWSILDRDRAARLIRRAIRSQEKNTECDESVKSRIWSRLPWKRHASGGGS